MTHHPSSLADQFGSLRASVESDSAHGWLPAALHALIMACLARLFARLEQIVLLWQSGKLVVPPAVSPSAARAPAHDRPRAARPAARAPLPRTPRVTHPAIPVQTILGPAIRLRRAAPAPGRLCRTYPSHAPARPRSARAPPVIFSKSPKTATFTHVENVSI